ncbi:MAG TPA: ROK family protein [Burkholderiales bacterium]|nr:ROK family protein [Burkholderiales bacterium]
MTLRMGVDLGGTKIELAVFDERGGERLRRRVATPHAGYDVALEALAREIVAAERDAGGRARVGIGMPGGVSPASGRVFNAYNTPFNGRRLKQDLEGKLGREVRVANDAKCFALSEALDGAAAGARVVFGVILGTGAGGGIVVDRDVLRGHNGISGEWGHTPLPWMTREEHPGPPCFCGRQGCIEQFIAGPALAREKAARGEAIAMQLHEDRLARALSLVVNFLDPDVIVLGGGLSNLERLYVVVPRLLPRYVYAQSFDTPLVKARHGDASGVRGAAMLWPA